MSVGLSAVERHVRLVDDEIGNLRCRRSRSPRAARRRGPTRRTSAGWRHDFDARRRLARRQGKARAGSGSWSPRSAPGRRCCWRSATNTVELSGSSIALRVQLPFAAGVNSNVRPRTLSSVETSSTSLDELTPWSASRGPGVVDQASAWDAPDPPSAGRDRPRDSEPAAKCLPASGRVQSSSS